jgi:lysyl-tRNA synthetase class 2
MTAPQSPRNATATSDRAPRSRVPQAYDGRGDEMNLFGFLPGYETHIYASGREPAFLMLLAFVLTLAGTRFYTRMARVRSWGSANVGGVHMHHLVPGVLMSLVAGGLVIGLHPREFWVAAFAAVFGAGAALVLDEFAMLLHLDDVYWTTEGRLSIDACVAAVAFLGLVVVATFPLSSDSAEEKLGWWVADALLALNACLVVVTVLKGKLKLGLLGIVFFLFSLVGALRLAKPSSVWARAFYPEGSRRLRRSRDRDVARQTRWDARRQRLYDVIGGAPHLGSKQDKMSTPKQG